MNGFLLPPTLGSPPQPGGYSPYGAVGGFGAPQGFGPPPAQAEAPSGHSAHAEKDTTKFPSKAPIGFNGAWGDKIELKEWGVWWLISVTLLCAGMAFLVPEGGVDIQAVASALEHMATAQQTSNGARSGAPASSAKPPSPAPMPAATGVAKVTPPAPASSQAGKAPSKSPDNAALQTLLDQ